MLTALQFNFRKCFPQAVSWMQISRGSKYATHYGKMPGFILPKQKRKSNSLTQKLKMKFFRLKAGKTGRRLSAPSYGRDDFCLSKMNF
ncbi:hypothetical protein BC833DRAFT_618517 [Globomyces pollinis-pini]|nr:hypothetical protein BC833DRAFT_618517 [Globomyces pollinis-pini]